MLIVLVSKPTTAMSPSSGAAGNRESVARRWNPAKTSALSPIAANAVIEIVSARIDTIRRISTRRFSSRLRSRGATKSCGANDDYSFTRGR